MKKSAKKYIWSGTVDEIAYVVDELRQCIRDGEDVMGLSSESTTDEIWQAAADLVADYRDDERRNLDKELSTVIVVIGDCGRWNGRTHNVARIGYNLNAVVESPYNGCEEEEIYVDGRDVRWTGCHHDGRNYALFRRMKDDSKYEAFIRALNKATVADDEETAWKRTISRYTTSLRSDVVKVYGWDM